MEYSPDFELDLLLEDQDDGEQASRKPIVRWLIVVSLILALAPLYLIATTLRSENQALNQELENIQAALADEPEAGPEVEALRGDMARVQEQIQVMEAVQTNLSAGHIDWPQVLPIVTNYDESIMDLVAVSQTDNRLSLTGRAIDADVPIAYANMLEESGAFNRVIVQSITLLATPVPPTPTPTPVPTSTPEPPASDDGGGSGASGGSGDGSAGGSAAAAVVSTPTVDPISLMDEYEDDTHPQPIAVGEPQSHNFYPDYDIDNVVFIAKAGRTYQVSTSGLAPGVDTFITLDVGGWEYTNDDEMPGTLASVVSFQVPADYDVQVVAQVTNRGQYGADMSYQLIVEEIVPAQTPPPTATPVTPTSTPEPEATATPDRRDEYEKDDDDPASISIGESQDHNFYPADDRDRASFSAKDGRYYLITTSDLASGVDTYLAVKFDGETQENDDAPGNESGDYSSAVCLFADGDHTTKITVTNIAYQYGEDRTYTLSVSEVPALTFDSDEIDFGTVEAGGDNPEAVEVTLDASSTVSWSAEVDGSWLSIDDDDGTTEDIISVSADISGLEAGEHEGSITFTWATGCEKTLPVSITITESTSLRSDGSGYARAARQGAEPTPAAGEVEFIILVELRRDLP